MYISGPAQKPQDQSIIILKFGLIEEYGTFIKQKFNIYLILKALVALATLALAVSHTFSSPIANPEAEAQIGPEPVGPVIIDEVSSLFVKMYSSYHLVI